MSRPDSRRGAWVFGGMVEDARLAYAVGFEVANADAMPTWYTGDELEDERRASLEEAGE